jgi:hypothetical protein
MKICFLWCAPYSLIVYWRFRVAAVIMKPIALLVARKYRVKLNLDYISSNERMIREWWNGEDLEGSGYGLILSYYPGICLEGRMKTKTDRSQDVRSPGRDLNLGSPEYEAGVLRIELKLNNRNVKNNKIKKKSRLSLYCKAKQSCPATRHGGAWVRGGIAPTHCLCTEPEIIRYFQHS